MHELGVVFHIMDAVEAVGRDNSLCEVSSVTLELGEVSTVLETYLRDCWNWARKKSELLRGAELRVEPIPAVTLCEDCGEQYGTVAHGKTCPKCGSGNTYLLRGSEVSIKEIEAR